MSSVIVLGYVASINLIFVPEPLVTVLVIVVGGAFVAKDGMLSERDDSWRLDMVRGVSLHGALHCVWLISLSSSSM